MSDTQPTVFISSTVYDFRDLRTALKFWLEELGYRVLLSEQNDFPVQADLSSYDNCLQSIDACDYFIVLIGSRVGGWYNQVERISITQAEYRRALSRLENGKIKLLAFVRQEIWNIREDRKELERFLRSDAFQHAETSDSAINKISKHPSKFVNDPDFTFDLLREIARTDEMKSAVSGNENFPIGNWIHQFSDFRDIIDALRVDLRISDTLRRTSLLVNLKAEITENLQVLIERNEKSNKTTPKYTWAMHARQSLQGSVDDSSEYKGRHLKWLGIFVLFGCDISTFLSSTALDAAIASGEMLDFDNQNDALVIGPLQQTLLDLRKNIERLKRIEGTMEWKKRFALSDRLRNFKEDDVQIANIDLLPALTIHDLQANIIALSRALYLAAHGDTTALHDITLYDDTPLESENEKLQQERPSKVEIAKWIAEGSE